MIKTFCELNKTILEAILLLSVHAQGGCSPLGAPPMHAQCSLEDAGCCCSTQADWAASAHYASYQLSDMGCLSGRR